jgi:hypothetical protein
MGILGLRSDYVRGPMEQKNTKNEIFGLFQHHLEFPNYRVIMLHIENFGIWRDWGLAQMAMGSKL